MKQKKSVLTVALVAVLIGAAFLFTACWQGTSAGGSGIPGGGTTPGGSGGNSGGAGASRLLIANVVYQPKSRTGIWVILYYGKVGK